MRHVPDDGTICIFDSKWICWRRGHVSDLLESQECTFLTPQQEGLNSETLQAGDKRPAPWGHTKHKRLAVRNAGSSRQKSPSTSNGSAQAHDVNGNILHQDNSCGILLQKNDCTQPTTGSIEDTSPNAALALSFLQFTFSPNTHTNG